MMLAQVVSFVNEFIVNYFVVCTTMFEIVYVGFLFAILLLLPATFARSDGILQPKGQAPHICRSRRVYYIQCKVNALHFQL